MQKITPCLWFDDNIEDALNFYTSVFSETKIEKLVRYDDAVPAKNGQVLTAILKIFGQDFMLLNGGPMFTFTEATSFVVHCQTQDEVDYYWTRLSDGGQESMCGWLKDKFGLSWQVVPDSMVAMLSDNDSQKAARVMQAMMSMRKINLAVLEKAYNEDSTPTRVLSSTE